VFADTEWDAFLQSFYMTSAQGLLSMFVDRATNGTQAVWVPAKAYLVRAAAAISQHRARRLRGQEPENLTTEWVSVVAYADESHGGKGKNALDGAGGVEYMAGGMSLEVLEAMLALFYQARDAVRKKSQPRLWRDTFAVTDALVEPEGPDVAALEKECQGILEELSQLDPQFHIAGVQNVWIIKASNSSKGVGITLFDKLSQVADCKGSTRVLQKYIERPLLVEGKKFDLRCWVLVTDWNPLTIWLYDECIARFCSDPWNLSHIGNRFAHLSNVSVNKDRYSRTDGAADQVWSSQAMAAHLAKITGRPDVWEKEVQPKIKDLIAVALRSAQAEITNRKGSFELYGFDIMLDDRLHPWLLEINLSPDLRGTSPVKAAISHALVDDMLTLVLDIGHEVLDKVPAVGVHGSFEQQWQLILQTLASLGMQLPQHPLQQIQRPSAPIQHAAKAPGGGGGKGAGEGGAGGAWKDKSEVFLILEDDDADLEQQNAERDVGGPHAGEGGEDGGEARPAPPPSAEPGRWCCIYRDAEEVEAYEGSDLQLEVQGVKLAAKQWRVVEAGIDSYIMHCMAIVIQRRANTFLATRRLKHKRRSALVLQAYARQAIHLSHLRRTRNAAAALQAILRQRQQHGKYDRASRASQLQRLWRRRMARHFLAKHRHACVRIQCWSRGCADRAYCRGVLHLAEVSRQYMRDGRKAWPMEEEYYLATPLAFVWAMLGMVGADGRATGLRAADGHGAAGAWRDPELWRRRCLQSVRAYGPGGGSTAVGILQRGLRCALSRRALTRRRASGLLCCAAKRAVAGARYGRVLATLQLQALLLRYRCCGGGVGGLARGTAGQGDDLGRVGSLKASSAAAVGFKRVALPEVSYLVDVSSSSACSSANATPCMTPTTPAGYLHFRHPGSTGQPGGRNNAVGGGGKFVAADDDEVGEEYSFEYEKDGDDEYEDDYEDCFENASTNSASEPVVQEQEEQGGGEVWRVRAIQREEAAIASPGGGGAHGAAGSSEERRGMVWVHSAQVSEGYFYMDSATFSSSFSLVKWRSAVALVAPRLRMAAARAAFRQTHRGAHQLVAVVRRVRAAAVLCAKCRAAALLLRHIRAHVQRDRYFCDRARASAARVLAALVLRRGRRDAYGRTVAARLLLQVARRACARLAWRDVFCKWSLAAAVVFAWRSKEARTGFLHMRIRAACLQAAVRRHLVVQRQEEAAEERQALIERELERTRLEEEAARARRHETDTEAQKVAARVKERAQALLRRAWLAHQARVHLRKLRQMHAARGVEQRLRQRYASPLCFDASSPFCLPVSLHSCLLAPLAARACRITFVRTILRTRPRERNFNRPSSQAGPIIAHEAGGGVGDDGVRKSREAWVESDETGGADAGAGGSGLKAGGVGMQLLRAMSGASDSSREQSREEDDSHSPPSRVEWNALANSDSALSGGARRSRAADEWAGWSGRGKPEAQAVAEATAAARREVRGCLCCSTLSSCSNARALSLSHLGPSSLFRLPKTLTLFLCRWKPRSSHSWPAASHLSNPLPPQLCPQQQQQPLAHPGRGTSALPDQRAVAAANWNPVANQGRRGAEGMTPCAWSWRV